jgi:diaminohydroxyphosphoribosylaminopyrimidine deaminase/5-amino-6-(5-phosphoribosylamino)uracil reductase
MVVRDGATIGTGFHRAAGQPHAEAYALLAAGELARGATVYVSLEPCAHYGRTPPCTDALIEAGVSRVVVGVLDPDPRVAGRGVDQLRQAGIRVDVGVGGVQVEQSLAPYLLQRRTGRAYTVLKAAISLDGRTAAADGTSKWISGPEARADAHAARAAAQAVLVGAGTALADAPALTVRDVAWPVGRQPLRVLLDSTGRVPARGPLFETDVAPTLVITTLAVRPESLDAWESAGAEVVKLPRATDGQGVDLDAVLQLLAGRGVLQVLVEGGPTLHAAFVRAGLADRLLVYLAGCTLGAAGRPLLDGAGPRTLLEARRWRLVSSRPIGNDVRLEYAACPTPAEAA